MLYMADQEQIMTSLLQHALLGRPISYMRYTWEIPSSTRRRMSRKYFEVEF